MPHKPPSQTLQHLGVVRDEDADRVRAEVFKPLDDFARWQKIVPREMRHAAGCGAWNVGRAPLGPDESSILFETCALDEAGLNQYAWDTLAAIAKAAEIARTSSYGTIDVALEPVTHWATCRSCKAEVSRSSVRVSIIVNGRVLVREYSL